MSCNLETLFIDARIVSGTTPENGHVIFSWDFNGIPAAILLFGTILDHKSGKLNSKTKTIYFDASNPMDPKHFSLQIPLIKLKGKSLTLEVTPFCKTLKKGGEVYEWGKTATKRFHFSAEAMETSPNSLFEDPQTKPDENSD